MILIDFDRTLFDSDGFYGAIRALAELSVDDATWQNMYKQYQADFKRMDVFSMINLTGLLDKTQMSVLRSQAAERAPDFLYSDSITFLEYLRKSNKEYTILTYGDEVFQKYKIVASGLGSHAHAITINPKKDHPIAHKASVMIDDNPQELAAFHRYDIVKYRMKRHGAKYTDQQSLHTDWIEIDSLMKLMELL